MNSRCLLLAVTAAAVLTPPLCAATWTWDGGASGDQWSLAANWTSNTPLPNDGTADVIFSGFSRLRPVVDAPWSVRSINFASEAGYFLVSGQALTVGAGGIIRYSFEPQSLHNPITLAASQTWQSLGPFSFDFHGVVNTGEHLLTLRGDSGVGINLHGAITGNGGVSVASGTAGFAGSATNSYTGPTTISSGGLILGKTGGAMAVPGNVTVGDGIGPADASLNVERDNQIPDHSDITVNADGTFIVGYSSEAIDQLVVNGGLVQVFVAGGSGRLAVNNVTMQGGTIAPGPGTFVLGGDLNIRENTASARLLGRFDLGAGSRTFSVADGPAGADAEINGEIFRGTLIKAGPGKLRLTDIATTPDGSAIKVDGGTLAVDGDIFRSSVTMGPGTTLTGAGTIGVAVFTGGGLLEPGNGTGTLTLANLTLAEETRLRFDLSQPGAVGGSNDLLTVNGVLVLDGALAVTELAGFAEGTYRLFTHNGPLTDRGLELDTAFLARYPGSVIDASRRGRVELIVVPEPSAAMLVALGAACAPWRALRRPRRPV